LKYQKKACDNYNNHLKNKLDYEMYMNLLSALPPSWS